MGMFDTFYVAPRFNLECSICKSWLVDHDFQTKDLDNLLNEYFLEKNKKVYLIESPCDKNFWYEYTDEEIKKHNEKNPKALFKRNKGDGFYEKGAFLFENREWKPIINIPKMINIYTSCRKCDIWIDLFLYFNKKSKLKKILVSHNDEENYTVVK